jgi:hypothetical protein
MQTFANYFTRSRNIYLPKMASLGNAAVWAWDTLNKVVNTDLVDNKLYFH